MTDCFRNDFGIIWGRFGGRVLGTTLGRLWVDLGMIFKRISPEQAFLAKTLLDENFFVIAFLVLLVFTIEKILKSHKDRHRSYLNKLAEIEWIEQYGTDGKS